MDYVVIDPKRSMKLYLVSVEQFSYREFDSAVVRALDEDGALELSKELFLKSQGGVTVKCIGYSESQTEPEIILASFNTD